MVNPIDFATDRLYMRPMRRMRLYISLFVIALIVLSAAGYAAFWYAAAGKVRDEIARWAVERRAAGWQVQLDEPVISGFPFRIEVSIGAASIAGPGEPPAWAWTAPRLGATAKPWRPEHLDLSAPGLHLLTVGEDTFRVNAAKAAGELDADDKAVRAGRFTFQGISVSRGEEPPVSAEAFDIRVGPLAERDRPAGNASGAQAAGAKPAAGIGLSAHATAITVPELWSAPLGRTVESVGLEAVITGDMAPGGKVSDMLTRWRTSGGVVEVEKFSIVWRALRLAATGTFALDASLQPQGATTAEIDGLDQAADALTAAGMIDARTAFAAKVANKALTLGGGPARLPFTIQQQQVYLGPVPMARLKAVKWD